MVSTNKELHGWWPGKRECTSERMLINPYNGCSVGCPFCYTLAFPGYFQIFRKTGVVVVAKDFHRRVAEQLDSLEVAACGYLSPVSDPFQLVNERYRLSEKIIEVFVERNLPIEFITKMRIPEKAIEFIKRQSHSFGQVSLLTSDEKLRRILVPGGAPHTVLLENLTRLAREGIFSVCRIDPIFPYLSDKRRSLEELVEQARSSGTTHIITSILDIPTKIKADLFGWLGSNFGAGIKWDYQRLYRENIDGYLQADINYRKKIFDLLRNICERKNLTFALCMEYELKDSLPQGLNREFMSSHNCEGIDIPIYRRRGKRFSPADDCLGNCLNCQEATCGIEDLAMGREGSKKDWRLKDWRRWSRKLKEAEELF